MKTTLRASAVVMGAVFAAVIALLLLETYPPRQWLADRVSRSVGRPVDIAWLEIDALSRHPGASIGDLRIASPSWAGAGDAVRIPRLDVSIDLRDLLRARLVLTHVAIEEPFVDLRRDASGRINVFEQESAAGSARPLDLPPIRTLVIDGGRFEVHDQIRDLELRARFAARESAGAASSRFLVRGDGEMNGQPFELQIGSEALANVVPGTPWPFAAYVKAGDTRVIALGRLEEAFDLGRLDVTLEATGPDLGRLYTLTGLALPETPPYRLQSRIVRDGARYEIRELRGTVGDSDVRGTGEFDAGGPRPRLSAQLRSDTLDLDDLRTVLGAPPATGPDETASAEQKALARRMKARGQLLPRARLESDRLHSLDASVRLRATDFRATNLPIRSLRVDIELRDGRLALDPLVVDLESGRAKGSIRFAATEDPPRTEIDIALENVDLGPLVRYRPESSASSEPALDGLLDGRIRLQGHGRSVHETASVADGEITLVVPRGAVRRAFAELTGIHVAEALGLVLSGDTELMGVRCAVAHFELNDGTARLESMVLDTDDVLITGGGAIELGAEEFDLEIDGRAKKPRLVRARSGITVRGPLRDPELGIEEENLLAQGAVGAALAALVTPVAALLALVDPGLAEDENCAALIAASRDEAQTRG